MRAAVAVGLLSISIAACGGDDGATKATSWNSIDCPRLERTSFEDCTYDEHVDLSSRESVEQFCDSTCDKTAKAIRLSGPLEEGDIRPKNLKVLRGLTEVGSVEIDNSGTLETLDGLDDLERVQYSVSIKYDKRLADLSAIGSLKSITGDLIIEDNDAIRDLAGLDMLAEVDGIAINYCDSLESIASLDNLEKLNGLTVTENPRLPTCQAQNLADKFNLSGDSEVLISNNGQGTCE